MYLVGAVILSMLAASALVAFVAKAADDTSENRRLFGNAIPASRMITSM